MADIRIPIDEMTLDEKLQAMEILWEGLIQCPERVPSPDWHGEVLAEREEALKRGEEQFEDFETAKANILKQIRDRKTP